MPGRPFVTCQPCGIPPAPRGRMIGVGEPVKMPAIGGRLPTRSTGSPSSAHKSPKTWRIPSWLWVWKYKLHMGGSGNHEGQAETLQEHLDWGKYSSGTLLRPKLCNCDHRRLRQCGAKLGGIGADATIRNAQTARLPAKSRSRQANQGIYQPATLGEAGKFCLRQGQGWGPHHNLSNPRTGCGKHSVTSADCVGRRG